MQALDPIHLFMLAATASMLIILPVWRLAPQLGLLDVPDARKIHSNPVPRVGGWGIAFGIVVPLLLWSKSDPILKSFIAGSLVLFGFGVWDDAKEIGHWVKFLGQIAAAGILVYFGGLYISFAPFMDGSSLPPAIGKPFTVFALVGVINAVNHSDGLDGLAAGETMLSLIAFAILGYLGSCTLVIGVALAAVGGVLGFLRYNSYPARVFMGDSGSQVLGFTVGFLAVYLTQVGDAAVSPAIPLLVIGLPIADILAVLYQRISGGMNWFRATRNHVHHRLLDLGFKHYETVIIIYSVQALLVMSAVLLRYDADLLIAGLYMTSAAVLFGTLTFAERARWRRSAGRAGGALGLVAMAGGVRLARLLRELPRALLSIAVPAFMLLSSLWAARIPSDVSLVSALLAAAVAMEIGRARANGSTIVRFAVYVAAISSVYLITNYPGATERTVQLATLALVTTLAAAISGYVKFASDRKFGTTPTDYLIVFAVLALLIFGSIDIDSRTIVEVVVYAVVLLYSCEVLIGLSSKRWNVLHISTLASLTIMALRGAL